MHLFQIKESFLVLKSSGNKGRIKTIFFLNHSHIILNMMYEYSWTEIFRILMLYISTLTGWPGWLVLRQGAVNQLFLGVFLMFLACLDHKWWAQFHLGILGPQEWKKSSEILSWKKVRFQDLLKLTFFWFPIFWLFVHNFL